MNKQILKTKTFWTSLAAIGTGIGMIVSGDLSAGIPALILGVQGIVLRDAIAKK